MTLTEESAIDVEKQRIGKRFAGLVAAAASGAGSAAGPGSGGLLLLPKLRVSSRSASASKKSSNEVFRSNSFKFERYERAPPPSHGAASIDQPGKNKVSVD